MVSATGGGNVINGERTPSEAETLYDALGVPENATIEEVKRAYYRLVRQFRPNEDPETFQKFNEASRTLTDARRRGEYDQNRRAGRRVQILMDQAAAALDRDAQKAVALLKNAIALAPDMPRPRHLLAHVLIRIEDYALAEKQYRWLLKEYPRDESLLFRIARCQFLQTNYEAAKKTLVKTFALNPGYHDAIMLQAKIHEVTGEFDAAIEMLEKAIANDHRENYSDLEAFVRLLALHFLREDTIQQEATIKRVLAILSAGDQEKADRAAQRFILRSLELEVVGATGAAQGMLDVAIKFTDASPEVREEATALYRKFGLLEDSRHLEADELPHPALKDCLLIKYTVRTTDAQRTLRMEAAIAALQAAILTQPRHLQQGITYIRSEYPRIASDHTALLDELLSRITRRLEIIEANNERSMPEVLSAPVTPEPESEKPARKGILDIFRRK